MFNPFMFKYSVVFVFKMEQLCEQLCVIDIKVRLNNQFRT